MTELLNAMTASAMGMKAQSSRVNIISQNMANANSTGSTADEDPYRRQIITFKNVMDRELGMRLVDVDKVTEDKEKPFKLKYEPNHPAADEKGYIKLPNVNTLIEMSDMREAQRSYEANLGMVQMSKDMVLRTIDLLRN